MPGAIVGIILGSLTFRYVDEDAIRLILGTVALLFAISLLLSSEPPKTVTGVRKAIGVICGTVAGYTSFVAHAGGAPVKFFLLPQRMDKTLFVGTTAVLFFVINQVKLIPYFMLGQLSFENLTTSLALTPLVPVGIWLGLKLHKIIPQELFFKLSCGLLFMSGTKLIWDGLH